MLVAYATSRAYRIEPSLVSQPPLSYFAYTSIPRNIVSSRLLNRRKDLIRYFVPQPTRPPLCSIMLHQLGIHSMLGRSWRPFWCHAIQHSTHTHTQSIIPCAWWIECTVGSAQGILGYGHPECQSCRGTLEHRREEQYERACQGGPGPFTRRLSCIAKKTGLDWTKNVSESRLSFCVAGL